MAIPFKWVREPQWRCKPTQVIAMEINPEIIQPAISVQHTWNKSSGIIRGVKENGILVEDHIHEELDEYDRLRDAGRRISGADEMRKHVWTVDQHRSAYQALNPSDAVMGWVGNGNLLNNPWFVGFIGRRDPARLYHLQSESKYLAERSYSCLVVRRKPYEPRVNIENLRFEYSNGEPRVLDSNGDIITNQIEYATFGQHIVRDGLPIKKQALLQMCEQEQFYDLRHVFLFGRIPLGEKRWIDAGLAGLWKENQQMDKQALENAVNDNIIEVNIEQFSKDDIAVAMDAKGYDKEDNPQKQGQYCIDGSILKVRLLEGIYPHNIIGLNEKRDKLISVVIRGLGNRAGLTILGASQTIQMLGAHQALMIDNGGDVMMSFGKRMALESAEGERSRLRSVMFFRTSLKAVNQLEPDDFKLIEYPLQYSM